MVEWRSRGSCWTLGLAEREGEVHLWHQLPGGEALRWGRMAFRFTFPFED